MKYFESNSNTYNTRSDKTVNTRVVKSVFNGTETVTYIAQTTWDMVPQSIKQAPSLNDFKLKIKKWLPAKCLCKTYVDGIRFVDIMDQV